MKYIVNVSRILVGLLFIISGLIKLNDPIGFSFKLEEYFSSGVLNLPFLESYALAFAIVVVIFEVLLGVFLLIGYKPKFTVWSLLGMIVFFTFLTFYSAYFNKVTDCGCFGDAIKLTPWESFSKDIILLGLIIILFIGRRHIKPILSKFGLTIVSLVSFIACLSFGYYVIMHLPAVDFRPYNIGANIEANMTVPADAPKGEIDYHWKFMVDGKEQIITTTGQYPTVDGTYVGVDYEEIVPAYVPPIHDFTMEQDGEDYAPELLQEPKLVMVVMYSLAKSEVDGMAKLKDLVAKATSKGYKIIGVTASNVEDQNQAMSQFGFDLDFYFCDQTALKTIVRSNPGVLVLNKGTITQKVHWNDIEDLKL